MKKNVFQGFSDKVLNNLNLVRGGITYQPTQAPGGPDEEAICAANEYDPFNGTTTSYESIDATWWNCEGVSANPRVNGYANGWQRIN
ncbi:MAG: hypothetical protein IT222_12180 [Crocinitomix sp.]|nr:hypothetical protein [Crocinitomix sp.]